MMILRKPALAHERVAIQGNAAMWVRAATTYDYDVARGAMALAMERIAAGEEMAEVYGLPVSLPALDEAARAGAAETVMNVELGLLLIDRLEGITLPDGAAATPTRGNLGVLFLDPGIRAAFRLVAFRSLNVLAAEGNASAPSPSGAAAGAPNIAADAARPASLAPAAGAA